MGNRNVVIIGASSGLGAGMAREFARRGLDLGLCARRIERLEALKAELEAAHPGIRVVIRMLDVTDYPQVFAVVRGFRDDFGELDRVVVNAGIGQGMPVGKGGFERNKAIIETNLIAALAQCEAAMEIFRAQDRGHLAVIASVSAIRGFRGGLTAYAASKAGVASLAEGIRADMLRKPRIKVSTLLPGYIRTEMNEDAPAAHTPFMIDGDRGCRLLAEAVLREPDVAYVPWWPWAPLGWLLKRLPLAWVVRLF
jgi:short-subunit dehydrogenase